MADSLALTEATYYILYPWSARGTDTALCKLTEELSGGRVRLAAGTLYGALNALCAKGWIIQLPAEDDSRRKEYKLTATGLKVLNKEVARLRELADNGEKILRGE